MECKASDSKKLFKVFDASKRKKSRKKNQGLDDTNSLATDESNSLAHANLTVKSAKASLQDVTTAQGDGPPGIHTPTRERGDSSPSVSASPVVEMRHAARSPRRHRRPQRDGVSLALKAGMVSTPRSNSPLQDEDFPQADSFIYTFLEEAIKRDKRKHRQHSRRHEDRNRDGERERDRDREVEHERVSRHHHHRRKRDDIPSRDQEQLPDIQQIKPPINQAIDQALLLETFAKLCTTITEKNMAIQPPILASEVVRSQSHKSLQCEVMSQRDEYDQRPVRLQSREPSHAHLSRTRVRSQEDIHSSRGRLYSPLRVDDRKEKYYPPIYDTKPKYSKLNVVPSRTRDVGDDRYREYPSCPARSCTDAYRRDERRDYREYEEHRREPIRDRRSFNEDKRRYLEQKTSRSFEVRRDAYADDERTRRTSRSDCIKKRFEDTRDPRERRFDERRDKYYEDKERRGSRDRHYSNLPSKDRRSRRNLERFERASIEEEYRDRDRYSERERDSGLSVADGDTSTVSGKSNYLRVVKQEIAEQREAMDKMMKLWKELMRCFKGISQNQGQNKAVHESAATVQESAAAQLRLWRECMRRYETVARDVGDTDARLMEEITKQRSEMAEMAAMWQECLQRYRAMSSDFDSLKRQLETESPVRQPPPAQPVTCPETEGVAPQAPYRMPPNVYPPVAGYPPGSPLRSRASAPPAWWWCGEQPPPPPRRRSSPESRASRSRERRRHHKERNEPRYSKEKPASKAAGGGRSDHRHRKR